MKADVVVYLQQHFNDPNVSKVQSIQNLWSGYGEIARYFIPTIGSSVVVKIVQPPSQTEHPRGWNTAGSHQRKLDSYVNEAMFYEYYGNHLDGLCRIPSGHLPANLPSNAASLLIMEDLNTSGFAKRHTIANLHIVKMGLRWLAYFHAKYIGKALKKVWPIGTYWHLATRPDEYARLPASKLKDNAHLFDQALNNAKFQTLLHGDAKLANFCFADDDTNLAAVDFQYVGRGVGVKDVMYFLGSCLDDVELARHADVMFDEYFKNLENALRHYYPSEAEAFDFVALETEWRWLTPFAWADFERFLAGWAPEHYKLNTFMKTQTKTAIQRLSSMQQR